MSTWSVETVGGGVLRRAGAPGGPALWFVHALGDSSFAFLSASSRALWRYHASISLATPDALLGLGRSVSAASAGDGLGAEYRALAVPNLYYWSPANTPVATREYIHRHALCNRSFGGGHWPMIEDPDTTTQQIASFFEPLVAGRSE